MSEAEIFLIRQRMLGAKRAKAERGELILPLPAGYVRRPSGEAAFDPDEQAQDVVRLIFRHLPAAGDPQRRAALSRRARDPASGPRALRAGEGRPGMAAPDPGDAAEHAAQPCLRGLLRLRPPSGRSPQEDPRPPGHRESGERPPASGWSCCRAGFPPTSPRSEYRANLARLAASQQTAESPGAPRNGEALLSGLLRCGLCGGHRMAVSYHDPSARAAYGYTCGFYPVNYGTGDRCQHIAGPALDDYVARQVLDAVAPAALEVSMAAAAHAENERAALDKLWRQRVERGRYAADRARRQYQLADPENRLVTRQLEADWESALAEAGRLEAGLPAVRRADARSAGPRRAGRDQALASDLPRVWDAPTTTRADRKELLRILTDDVTVAVEGDSEIVNVDITWAGGHRTSGQAVRPVGRLDQLSYYPALLETVTRLAGEGRNSRQIADASTPRDTGRPSAPRSSPASRSATSSASTPSASSQRPARRPHGPGPRRVVRPGTVRRARHAHRQHLQLDLPRLDHRPPRTREQELDHHRRRAADARAPRAQGPPARLLHPRPLGTTPQPRTRPGRRTQP